MIRRAETKDIDSINNLLRQVLNIHQKGRPDIFKSNSKKYTDDQLKDIIKDDSKPIFVFEQDEKVLGYAFCQINQHINNNVLTDIKTLYVDDLCVDETSRGKHIGKQLYEFVLRFAKTEGCYNVTLNVWSCNENAMKFYEKMGLKPQKTYLEKILE